MAFPLDLNDRYRPSAWRINPRGALTWALILSFSAYALAHLSGDESKPLGVEPQPLSKLPAYYQVLFSTDPVIREWLPRYQAAGALEQGNIASEELYGPCAVTRIVDGDTVDVICDGQRTRVRLLNIDTPESGEWGYSEATFALTALLGDRETYLGFEYPAQPTRGKYGRLLAYLYDADGRNLNLEMVKAGWTPFYRKYGDGRLPASFAAAHLEAYLNSRGLWGVRWFPSS